MSIWTGRDDTPTEGPNALRWWQCVKPYTPDAEPGIVLIGFACDEGVRRNGGRVGAKDGPRALRKALANMAWRNQHPIYDGGDVHCVESELEAAQDNLREKVSNVVRTGHRPLVLGGGHETAWGTFRGAADNKPDSTWGIVNIDAHFDLRLGPSANSGTPFSQIADWFANNRRPFRYAVFGISDPSNSRASVERAHSLGTKYLDDFTLPHVGPNAEWGWIRNFVRESEDVYLSLDLDVLSASIMPAVSAPAIRGVALDVVANLIDEILDSHRVVAVDVVEFNPAFDINGCAARVAAGLIWKIAAGWTAARRPHSV
ncbi:MAG: formimidoylglutamase [Gemmataceae bacterium]